jgi:hypothetical protein
MDWLNCENANTNSDNDESIFVVANLSCRL